MTEDQITAASLAASERFQNYCINPSAEDIAYYQEWLRQHPQHRNAFKEAKEIVRRLALQVSEREIQDEFDRFQAQTQKARPKIISLGRKRRRPFWGMGRISAAAGIALLLVFGLVYLSQDDRPVPKEITTDYGQIVNYTFSDGTKVILNANSKIRFDDQWPEDGPRTVQLEGEAFFEVTPSSAENPFLVHTPKGLIRVLGTSFNVSQRSSSLEVALLEGKVELLIRDHPRISMEPGESVVLEEGREIRHAQADVDASSAWRFQRMVFKQVSIERITQRLKDEFDLTVKVNDAQVLQRKVNATIPKNDPQLLLEALSEIYDLKITKIDDKNYLID